MPPIPHNSLPHQQPSCPNTSIQFQNKQIQPVSNRLPESFATPTSNHNNDTSAEITNTYLIRDPMQASSHKVDRGPTIPPSPSNIVDSVFTYQIRSLDLVLLKQCEPDIKRILNIELSKLLISGYTFGDNQFVNHFYGSSKKLKSLCPNLYYLHTLLKKMLDQKIGDSLMSKPST